MANRAKTLGRTQPIRDVRFIMRRSRPIGPRLSAPSQVRPNSNTAEHGSKHGSCICSSKRPIVHKYIKRFLCAALAVSSQTGCPLLANPIDVKLTRRRNRAKGGFGWARRTLFCLNSLQIPEDTGKMVVSSLESAVSSLHSVDRRASRLPRCTVRV